jgi:hypothetical protein
MAWQANPDMILSFRELVMTEQEWAAAQRREVDRNFDCLQRQLSEILPEHEGQYALMRDGRIVGYFDNVRAALTEAANAYPDRIFSVQEVTAEPVDLGAFSHAGG